MELKDALQFYQSAGVGFGGEFLAEVQAATDLIESIPLAWLPLSPRTRRCRTHRFPYGLFYQVRSDEILIISVMDLRRDSKRWEQYL
jgi:ParE toxin of type II toxin-antitoxin system, parDE